MFKVVQQIDYLTSSIDLNDEEQQGAGGDGAKPPSDSSYSSGSSSSEVTVGSTHLRPPEPDNLPESMDSSGTLRRDLQSRNQSPQNVQLCPINSGFLSERSRTHNFTCSLGMTSRQGGPLPHANHLLSSNTPQPQNLASPDHHLSPPRSLPVRPPTPGLSPLTVNLHHPNSPGSQPQSPGASSSIRISPVSPSSPLCPKPYPPPALSPSVIIETKVGSYQTTQSDLPSAGPVSPSSTQPPSAGCPPTDCETQTVSATASAATAKPATSQGRRGRKPPPYPHHRLSEHIKKVKEPRKVPPYPEKRRLLSTTV